MRATRPKVRLMGKEMFARATTRRGIVLMGSCAFVFGCADDSNLDGGGGASSSTTASMGAMTTASITQSSSLTGIDPTCIPSEPTWSPNEGCGVFVQFGATSGGTPASPFGTIAEAQAARLGASIYACEGTYTESITLAQSESLSGGLACGTWAYDPGKRPTLTAAPDAVPLRIIGTGAHRVETATSPPVAIAYVGNAPMEKANVMLDVAASPSQGGVGGDGGPTNMGGIGAMGSTALRQAW